MRLSEIINSQHVFAELSPSEVKQAVERLVGASSVLDLNAHTQLIQDENLYGVRRNGEVVGWVELSEAVEIGGKTYQPIKFIYVIPSFRKTRTVGLFLLGLKKILPHPLILGSDSYGGVLFAGGVELVRALGDSKNFVVSALDLRTGKTEPVTNDAQLDTQKHKTLVFEEDDFPLYHDAGIIGRIYLFQD